MQAINIQVLPAEYHDLEALRELYRHEANCQIRYDSMPVGGLADLYLILAAGRVAGYGAVLSQHHKGRLTEFYALPTVRSQALAIFRELLAVSQATHIAAQTNIPLLLTLLYDCAENITDTSILFHDAGITRLTCPGTVFRHVAPEDTERIFEHHAEPVGEWVVEEGGKVMATGGFTCNYNPPYGDLCMEVAEPARGRGIGSFLVQELKQVCYEAGKRPAARCDPGNVASRRTLEKAGFFPCARLLVGAVAALR